MRLFDRAVSVLKSAGKGKKKKRKDPMQNDGRRATGVPTELPFAARLTLGAAGAALALGALCWGGKALFNQYYVKSRGVFVMPDVWRDVTISTGKTLTPDTIHQVLKLADGMNQFTLPIQEKRAELMGIAPNIKDMEIVRRLPDQMAINIVEREPIARVGAGTDGRVVDEEGVVFCRYAGVGGLPLITGADLVMQAAPGDRLRDLPMAAVRLVYNLQRPEVRLRLLEVRVVKDDYLRLTMSDHRQAAFAWDSMTDEAKDTVAKMQEHFDQLELLMESEVGRACLMWDATIPGRITATVPGLNL